MYYGFSFIVTLGLVLNGATTYFTNGTLHYDTTSDIDPVTGIWTCPLDGYYLFTSYSLFQSFGGVTFQLTSGFENIMNSNQHGAQIRPGPPDYGFATMNVRPYYITAGTQIRAYLIPGFSGDLLSSYGIWTVTRLE